MDPIEQSLQFWTKIQSSGTYVISALFAIAGVIFYFYAQSKIDKYQELKNEKEIVERAKEAKRGKISGGKKENKEVILSVFLGTIGFGAFSEDLEPNGIDLEDEEQAKRFSQILPVPIKVKLINGEVLVSMKIISADGKIVGEIIDNEWEVNPNNYFKRNYDSTGFEVIDSEGIIKVAIDIANGTFIYVHGIMYWNEAYVFMPSVRHITKRPDFGHGSRRIVADKVEIEKLSRTLPTLFKYPSDIYFGIRTELPKRDDTK